MGDITYFFHIVFKIFSISQFSKLIFFGDSTSNFQFNTTRNINFFKKITADNRYNLRPHYRKLHIIWNCSVEKTSIDSWPLFFFTWQGFQTMRLLTLPLPLFKISILSKCWWFLLFPQGLHFFFCISSLKNTNI